MIILNIKKKEKIDKTGDEIKKRFPAQCLPVCSARQSLRVGHHLDHLLASTNIRLIIQGRNIWKNIFIYDPNVNLFIINILLITSGNRVFLEEDFPHR